MSVNMCVGGEVWGKNVFKVQVSVVLPLGCWARSIVFVFVYILLEGFLVCV